MHPRNRGPHKSGRGDDMREEPSFDLMITPAKDEEKERMDGMRKGLDEERKKFTEAAVKLGKERARLEVGFFFSFVCSFP